jgi:hypothetical protein
MLDEEKVRNRVREMQDLIRIGRERLARHSPVWAVYLASETLRSLSEALDLLEKEAESAGAGQEARSIRKAV